MNKLEKSRKKETTVGRRKNINKLEKSRQKKKTTRREFLTTAGVLAAGTMVAGNVLAGELKKTLVAPKVAKKADPKLTLKEALRKARVKFDAKMARKVTMPSGKKLTIKEFQSKALVEADIQLIANKILAEIEKGMFTPDNLKAGLDIMHGMDFSIDSFSDFKLVGFVGNGCLGDPDGVGWTCGGGCDGTEGRFCGDDCGGNEGKGCGNKCPDKPSGMASSDNPFINVFIEDVRGNFNILSLGTNELLQLYSHDILGQVLGRIQMGRIQSRPPL